MSHRVAVDGGVGVDDGALLDGPGLGQLGEAAPGQRGGGLEGGAPRHQLIGVGHVDRPTEQVGHDLAVGPAARPAAHQQHPAVGFGKVVGAGEQVAHHPLDRSPGDLLAGHVGPQPGEHAGGVGSVGGAFAVEVGHQHQPAGSGRRGEGQVVDISLQQTGVYTIATDFSRTLVDGAQPKTFDRTAPDNPLFNTYPTRDGQWLLLVHMTPDPYWPKLCAALGRDAMARDPAYLTMAARRARGAELSSFIEAEFLKQDL